MTDNAAAAPPGPKSRPPRAAAAPPVNFYSIEFAAPARPFWEGLARLLGALADAARRKGARR